ncbi:MAG TPA: ATP-grasp domain-containing protein, partial [Chitinophagaceae bacterium]|nr:ATP-grasp domain-containing protein [Chitinophagaceae bacterium]
MSINSENTGQSIPTGHKSINILMTGAGAPGAAGIMNCLWQHPHVHISLADANPNAVGRYLNPDFTKIPFAEDPGFAESLLNLCREKNIHVLLPLVTKELIPLSQRRDEFELAGAKLLVSPANALEIANNKSRLYQFLEWRGIKVPAFRVVDTVEQFNQAVHELGYPGNSVCFKPSVSNGSRGFRIISPKIDELDLLLNQKPQSTYILLQDAQRILSTGSFPELLVSEWLPGEEFSVDCLARQGVMQAAIPRLRKKMINGISVEGEFVEEKNIMEYCRQII